MSATREVDEAARLRAELIHILRDVGPENVWRPVHDAGENLLAEGIADGRDGSPEDLAGVDFRGKSVVDLGCNFGYFSFLARRLGARAVVGVDIDPRAVRGCEILRALQGLEEVSFRCGDFVSLHLAEQFDLGLLVNYIGKRSVRKGVQRVLKAVERLSRQEMVVSARPVYHGPSHLGLGPEALARLYPARYLKGEEFFLMDFVIDFFHDDWEVRKLSPDYPDRSVKRTLLFSRKRARG
jgi:ribosomal protein L11 methyltransferase